MTNWLPCGTPICTGLGEEIDFPILVSCLRPDKKLLNNWSGKPRIPYNSSLLDIIGEIYEHTHNLLKT